MADDGVLTIFTPGVELGVAAPGSVADFSEEIAIGVVDGMGVRSPSLEGGVAVRVDVSFTSGVSSSRRGSEELSFPPTGRATCSTPPRASPAPLAWQKFPSAIFFFASPGSSEKACVVLNSDVSLGSE